MANSLSSLQFNEATISRVKQDPRRDNDEVGFMDLFSTLFEQVNSPENKAGFITNGKEKQIPSWDSQEKGLRMSNASDQRLSMEEILMVAGEKFIQFSTNTTDGVSMLFHPYGSSISGLCLDDERDVEIMQSLLTAAENVGFRQFDSAARLVSRCQWMVSESGSPVQRLGFHFAAALEQKIRKECGESQTIKNQKIGVIGHALGTGNTFLASHQQLPFSQVVQLAGTQAIIEHVKEAKMVHLIDLQIRSGIHWTALMQGLSESSSSLQRLKITAVGTDDQRYMEETGNRLQSFAQSLNLPFLFKVVYFPELAAFSEDLLNIEADETLAVYSFLMLRSMIAKPESLEHVMTVIARIRPAIMVVSEVEANHNSPSFIDRFTEALLFYSAYFDCLEECMDRCNEYRTTLECHFFGEGIMNIVAADDEERVTRNVKLGVWRKYFVRFGMIEVELSESAKYQASLVLEQFAKGRCCNLEFDGKGLIVGWKGTPIQSLTAWKFS